MKKGQLSELGYRSSDYAEDRHKALRKAVKKYGAGVVVLKLNAICILNKNRAPSSSEIFCRDKRWVQRTFGDKGRKK